HRWRRANACPTRSARAKGKAHLDGELLPHAAQAINIAAALRHHARDTSRPLATYAIT
ncbi:MAG: hypothetical protein QOI36_2757, partial [Pseudonocardiales bacterium]|nr:hypothetical protein [Pseudonocardiales bacterium]